jgi:hypothetical protein
MPQAASTLHHEWLVITGLLAGERQRIILNGFMTEVPSFAGRPGDQPEPGPDIATSC